MTLGQKVETQQLISSHHTDSGETAYLSASHREIKTHVKTRCYDITKDK
jgi:hypothetical protein